MNFGDNGPLPLDHIIHCPVESIIVVGMFVNIIIALLVAQVACSEDTANLRGHSKEKEKKALFNSATPYPIESRPKSNEAFVSKLFADMRENLEKEKAKAAAPKSELDYYQGGQGPQLSYGGYFVSRQRKLGNNWNECVGPGTVYCVNLLKVCTPNMFTFIQNGIVLYWVICSRNARGAQHGMPENRRELQHHWYLPAVQRRIGVPGPA